MIKLKIGDNYLITTNKDGLSQAFICYVMSRYSGHGRTLLGFDPNHNKREAMRGVINGMAIEDFYRDYAQAVREAKVQNLDVLFYKTVSVEHIRALANLFPNVKLRFIKITNEDIASRENKIAWQVVDAWKMDKDSILSHLAQLDEYKEMATRYKNIPGELKAVNENIKAMKKQAKVEEGKKTTLKQLEPLHLIENATLRGNHLVLDIYPLYLNPSEPLGKVYTSGEFENNPYLYEVAKHLYQGHHFKMPGTQIQIKPDFRPEFIDTKVHDFDDMFEVNNWSNVGYLHFGKGHLCGGEFNDVMAHAGEYGLEYYFLCLKQYITTANMRDIAGVKIWWYPIYDDEDNLVYCAGLEILRQAILDSHRYDGERAERIKNMSIQEFLTWKKMEGISFHDYRYPDRFRCGNQHTRSAGGDVQDSFLKVLEQREPELYKEIMKGSR